MLKEALKKWCWFILKLFPPTFKPDEIIFHFDTWLGDLYSHNSRGSLPNALITDVLISPDQERRAVGCCKEVRGIHDSSMWVNMFFVSA